jgi:SAM-dependent methyltransferase
VGIRVLNFAGQYKGVFIITNGDDFACFLACIIVPKCGMRFSSTSILVLFGLNLALRVEASPCRQNFLGKIEPSRDFSLAALQGKLVQPATVENFIHTTAGYGYMTETVDDPFSELFIKFSVAGKSKGPALDIGCAFGVACLPILRKGFEVIGIDPGWQELETLYSVSSPTERQNLTLIHGLFPQHSAIIPDGTVGSILISRVFHFMRPKEIRDSLAEAFRLLAPGGHLFVTAETPYFKISMESGFVAEYEQRIRDGVEWPGLNENVHRLYPNIKSGLPEFMHYMDPETLSREARLAGFQVQASHTFPRPKFRDDIRGDGRESVGLHAMKASTF